jgi:hypothetical protein
LDPDDDPDEPPFRDPLPPADRLWRHPSELDDDLVVLPDPIEQRGRRFSRRWTRVLRRPRP